MESFKSKYVILTAALVLIASEFKIAFKPGENAVQKFIESGSLIPGLLPIVSNVGQLKSEIETLKGSVVDMEAGAEVLVTELAFSSDAAKAIIPKAIAVAEWAVQGIEPIKELAAVI